MNKGMLSQASYDMAQAYTEVKTRDEVVLKVSKIFPDIPINVLEAMWLAIDAYVDWYVD